MVLVLFPDPPEKPERSGFLSDIFFGQMRWGLCVKDVITAF